MDRIPLWQLLGTFFSIFSPTWDTSFGRGNEAGQFCNSVQCEKGASALLVNLDQSVQPCDDFYAHACGGWMTKNPATEASDGIRNGLTELAMKTHVEIAELFKTVTSSDEALYKAKKYYESCMDWNAIQRRGLSPLEAILTENGEWPLLVSAREWNPQRLTWQQIHQNIMKRVGVSALLDIGVDIDSTNANAHIITLRAAIPPTRRLYTLLRMKRSTKPKDHSEYFNAIIEAFIRSKNLWVDRNLLQEEVNKTSEFNARLIGVGWRLWSDLEDHNKFSRIITIEALQNEWDGLVGTNPDYAIDWLEMIRDRFDGTGVVVRKSDRVALTSGQFVEHFAAALRGTDVKTIVNYMYWQLIDNLIHLTSLQIKNPSLLPTAGSGRLGTCINDHRMVHAVSYLYVKHYSSKATTSAVLDVVKYAREAMKRDIAETSWMDGRSKSAAREKIDALKNFIGYPEWFDEPGKIDEYYRELTVGNDYFDNGIAAKKFDLKIKLLRLRRSVARDENDWAAHPHSANAQYIPATNSLGIPSAVMRLPRFFDENPSILNYGSMGAIVGHEIAHAFDSFGRLYDKNGNKRDWWSQSAVEKYKTRAQCFTKQYGNFVIYEDPAEEQKYITIDGMNTLRENIADTTGFRTGFRLFQMMKNAGAFDSLKHRSLAHLSDDQLYFYQVAQTFCENVSQQGLREYAKEYHSLHRYRVNGAFSNIKEFSDAFNCSARSRMNPAQKCLIWD